MGTGQGTDERLRARLAELRAELERGGAELEAVERRRSALRDTLLRIGGAIQVLEELLGPAAGAGPDGLPAGDPAGAAAADA